MKWPEKITIKVNLVSLVKWIRKIQKWRRQNIINQGKDVPERPI